MFAYYIAFILASETNLPTYSQKKLPAVYYLKTDNKATNN